MLAILVFISADIAPTCFSNECGVNSKCIIHGSQKYCMCEKGWQYEDGSWEALAPNEAGCTQGKHYITQRLVSLHVYRYLAKPTDQIVQFWDPGCNKNKNPGRFKHAHIGTLGHLYMVKLLSVDSGHLLERTISRY